MKKLLLPFALGIVVMVGLGAGVKISDLALSTAPSTNTFLEIADLNAAGTNKSAKILYTNLVTQSRFNTLVGGLKMTGTPTVGDVATASDTTGTNGVWSAPLWASDAPGVANLAPGVTSLAIATNIDGTTVVGIKGGGQQGAVYVQNVVGTNGVSGFYWPTLATKTTIYATNSVGPMWVNDMPIYFEDNTRIGSIYGIETIFQAEGTNVVIDSMYGMHIDASNFGDATIGTYEGYSFYRADEGLGNYGSGTWNNFYFFHSTTPHGTFANSVIGLKLDSLVGVDAPSVKPIDYDNGAFSVLTNGVVSTVGGFISTASDAPVAISSSGWTNSLGKTAIARFDGTAMTYVVYNNAGSSVYTNSTALGHATEIVQSGGKIIITAGSGVTGAASPF